MRYFLIPIEAIEVIRPGNGIAHPEWILNIVEIRYVELPQSAFAFL